jgi:tRNA wybutosine-synthesizing protein 2
MDPVMAPSEEERQELHGTISVRKVHAEKVRSLILDEHLFDPERSIGRDDLMVHFPIACASKEQLEGILAPVKMIDHEAQWSHGHSRTVKRAHQPKPFDDISRRAGLLIGSHKMELLPGNWEMLGDCLMLKGMEALGEDIVDVARIYQSVLGARYTLLDEGGISGELRQPNTRVLVPPSDGKYEVEHLENSVRFLLDPRRIMFSSGNVDERMRIPDIINNGPPPPCPKREGEDGEVVVDMFAGIGYFTLPVAVHCKVKRIMAMEKNPESFGFLLRNIELNGVSNKVIPILGDNRSLDVPPLADRIIMGYVGGTLDYVPKALEIARPEGCIIHLHDTVPIETGGEGLMDGVSSVLKRYGKKGQLVSSRRVKSFAPRIDHVVLDIRIST